MDDNVVCILQKMNLVVFTDLTLETRPCEVQDQPIYYHCKLLKKINQSKFYLKSVHFITIQHKLSRAFQTDMHNKIT